MKIKFYIPETPIEYMHPYSIDIEDEKIIFNVECNGEVDSASYYYDTLFSEVDFRTIDCVNYVGDDEVRIIATDLSWVSHEKSAREARYLINDKGIDSLRYDFVESLARLGYIFADPNTNEIFVICGKTPTINDVRENNTDIEFTVETCTNKDIRRCRNFLEKKNETAKALSDMYVAKRVLLAKTNLNDQVVAVDYYLDLLVKFILEKFPNEKVLAKIAEHSQLSLHTQEELVEKVIKSKEDMRTNQRNYFAMRGDYTR